MGGTGRPLGKIFFQYCQWRHPELPKIPTYLPLLRACSFSAVTYITRSRGTPNIYNNDCTSCNHVIFFYYARESCVLGRRNSFVRKQVAIFVFFKTKNWCVAKRVVNVNRSLTMGTQEEYEIPPKAK